MFVLVAFVYPTDVVPGEEPSRISWFGLEVDADHLVGFGIWFCSALASFTHLLVVDRTRPVPTDPVTATQAGRPPP